MKFKSLLVATIAVAGLASCSSDQIGENNNVSGLNDIKVSVTVPNAFTRGEIEGSVENGSPIVKNVSAYVLRGKSQVAKMELTKLDEVYSANFKDLSLNGSERVVITANNKDVTDPQGYKIMDIQSNANAENVAAIYYFESAKLSSVVPVTVENKTTYTLDDMILKPIASRVEVSGPIDFEEKLVKSVDVTEITPNNYSETFGATERFFAQSTGQTVPPTAEGLKNLGELANAGFYEQITTGGKVVANHLFNGDEKRISFRMNATVYDVLKNTKGERIKPVNSANVQLDSYVYPATSGAEGSKTTRLYIKDADKKYYELIAADKGQIQVAGKKYNKSTTEKAEDVELDTYSTITDKNAGYFNMVKFAALTGETMDPNPSEFYEQGKIYKVFFNQIDWNKDGKIDGNDKYNPDENGDGGETPSNFDADIVVGATLMKWDIQNSAASIE